MRIIFTLLLSLLLIFSAGAQDFLNPENELHAPGNFIYKNFIPVKVMEDYPVHQNLNLSQNTAPQNEPSVRISRLNPDIVVAAWRDFRLGYLGSNIVRRIGYTYSTDGGLSWAPSQLLPDPAPDHISQSDPVVVSDMYGNFYISSTSRQPVTYYNREMLLYKSTDNGQSFQLHAIAVPGSGAQGEDKEWLFCDPVESNPTYNQLMMVWRSFGPTYGIRFRISEPGGEVWSPTRVVSDLNSGQGANVTTGVNGEIVVAWKNNGIYIDRSLDGGNTFGQDLLVSGFGWDNNGSFPYLCTDYSDKPSRGNIYLVWTDSRLEEDDVWFQRSTDGGLTWLPFPVRVNDGIDNDQFWPVVQCDTSGRVFVIYYDDRDNQGTYNTWLAWSDDQGTTWTNSRLNSSSFYMNMPNSDVRFGDYINVDTYAGKVIPVWTDDRSGGYDQEIYSAVFDITTFIPDYNKKHETAVIHYNYPNPFRESTRIRFHMMEESYVKLVVLDALGRELEVVFEGLAAAGEHEYRWENPGKPGVYHYVLTTRNRWKTGRMISLE